MAQVQITFQDVNVGSKTAKLITFSGQLDETNVDSEAKKIYQVIDEMAEPNLLLDFSDLEYMNSKSIGYVTDWYSKASAKNGKIVIARPRVNILDILKVVGITQIITIYDNLDEAKAAFGVAEVAAVGTVPAQTEAPEA
ncbi:STAS domain-containing protein [Patescibacteria group bacterium]|nr:STAS domain-containing protein [Patescibacteria group bacterium]